MLPTSFDCGLYVSRAGSSGRSSRPANDIQQRLSPFVLYNRYGTVQCIRKRRRIFYTFAVAACCLADLLECRQLTELNENQLVAPRCQSIGIHGARAALDRTPHRIVHDDEENGEIVQGRGMVYGSGIAEHVGAVADDCHDRTVGACELGSKRCAGPPAETGRRT